MEDINVSSSKGFEQVYDTMNNTIVSTNPTILIILTVIIVFYFIVFSYLGYSPVPESISTTPGMKMVEIIMWGLLIFLILINGLQYLFQVDIKTAIKDVFGEKPTIDVKIKKPTKMKFPDLENDSGLDNLERMGKQVFNIPRNDFTYKQAKALCKAYDADLATYNQIEDAYKSGAEWCNYGWSKNQMAFFPTQKTTYMKNPNVRFGVNCYGDKPTITEDEQKIMDNSKPYPLTKDELNINKWSDYYKKKLSSILISPFNYKNWSKI